MIIIQLRCDYGHIYGITLNVSWKANGNWKRRGGEGGGEEGREEGGGKWAKCYNNRIILANGAYYIRVGIRCFVNNTERKKMYYLIAFRAAVPCLHEQYNSITSTRILCSVARQQYLLLLLTNVLFVFAWHTNISIYTNNCATYITWASCSISLHWLHRLHSYSS